MNPEAETNKILGRLTAIFMSLVASISLLAVIGWLFQQPVLASFSPAYLPMAPSSALIFLGFCSIWMMQRAFGERPIVRFFLQLILLGMLILILFFGIRYLSGIGPDIQNLITPNPPMFGQVTSGRMSPLTALGFVLAIPAYYLLMGRQQGKRKPSISAIISMFLLILSGLYCMGYLLGAPLFYGGTIIPVALTTSLSFLFLSLGLMTAAGPDCWPVSLYIGHSIKPRLMRAFIPVSILIVLLQGVLSEFPNPWNLNPAFRVAFAALLACLSAFLIVYLIADNIGAEIERGDKARLQAESTLKQSEERFRMLFEHAAVGVALIETKTGAYLDINQKYCDFLGYTKEEMLKHSFQDITDPDYIQENVDKNALLLAGKIREFSIEKQYIHKNGNKLWGVLTVSPLWKPGEETPNFVHIAVVQDITARKRAEEALRESEDRFKKLFEEAPLGIALVDSLTGRSFEVNPMYAQIAGRTKEEILSANWMSFTHPDDIQEDMDNMALVIAGKIPGFQMQKRFIRPDGSFVWIEMAVAPIVVDDKAHPRHLCMIENISERKRSELIQDATNRITQAAITSDGIDVLYETIHAILRELIPAENFYISLYDSANGTISFPYYIDQYDKQPPGPTQTEGLTGYVIRSGRSLLTTPEVYDQLIQQGEVEAIGTKPVDWLGVPLKSEGRIIGVIVVQSYSHETHYNQKDMELLEFVSTQVAQAIERKRLEEEIRSLSLTDELTGLYNRRGFTLLAEQEVKLAHRKNRPMLLFFGDVDHLKQINDTYGHAQGDLALQEVANILKESFREADIVARMSGDEFVVLALDASHECAEDLIRRIKTAMETHNRKRKESYRLTLSIGAARYDPESPCTISELLATADGKMYFEKQARKAGK